MLGQIRIISKVINTGDASIITKNNLTADFFPEYKGEYEFIKAFMEQYHAVPDRAAFVEKFGDTIFKSTDVTAPDEALLDELYEDRKQSIITTNYRAMSECLKRNDEKGAERLLKEAWENVRNIQRVNTLDVYGDISRYDRYIEKTEHREYYYVTTGFEELDNIIGGWDRKNEYATIIARGGIGKTWLLVKCAAAAALAGLKVGFYEGEMEEDKISYRIDTMISNISNSMLTKGYTGAQFSYKEFLEDAHKMLSGKIKILTPSMVGGNVGVSKLRAFVETENLDILFIDQHSLLEDDRQGKQSFDKAANISKDIKQLQVMSQIPIITASQQNRESTQSEGVSTKNIAQSDRIGQDSTVVIALEKKDSILTMNIIKSRDGGDDSKLEYLVDLDKGRFKYIPSEEDGNPLHDAACEQLRNAYELSEDEIIQKPQLFDIEMDDEDTRPF